MNLRRHHRRTVSDTGSAALAQVVALGGLLFFVVLGAQLVLWSYGRGAVRAAAQEAVAQAARPQSSGGECQARFATVLDGLMGGSLGDGVGPPVCSIGLDRAAVEVDVSFSGWLPGVPDWSFRVVAVAPRDPSVEPGDP